MSTNKLRVGVMFGGRSSEHEVSLMSARSILSSLNPDKYHVTQIGITHEGKWLVGDHVLESMLSGETEGLTPVTILPDPKQKGLFAMQKHGDKTVIEKISEFDVVFPVLHGTFGEDGTLQGLFELADIAYVGAGVLGSSVGMDKGVFKDVMRANHISVAESRIFLRQDLESNIDEIIDQAELVAKYPLFVKPANMGSSVGISKCLNRSELYEGILDAARYDCRILVEEGINAREIEISVLGNDKPKASIAGEIVPAAEFYSYEAKYHDERSKLLIPAPISEALMNEMRDIAIKAYKAIDCAGMARVDFLLDRETETFYLNEINTIPGFTQISMYPKLWDATGLPYADLLDQLISLALERKQERDKTSREYQAYKIRGKSD
ncbi:MAG: D-alanine--D-alanine ligase [Anaerolineales bacterium]|nr:D-alanine--D-alanine ligase [Anaerolineales bacterium]